MSLKSNKKCFRCGKQENLSRDHIIPRRLGTTLVENKMILCLKCHRWKEENTNHVYRNGEIIGIYNPILKRIVKKSIGITTKYKRMECKQT